MKLKLIIILLLIIDITLAQNVIVVVIDGARYTETFGATNPSTNIPHLWTDLKPLGTIYENFYNTGVTATNSGHATILTGTWQSIANDGSQRPTSPTIFEYFRKENSALQSENYVVSGKAKLNVLTYSIDPLYGSSYMASHISENVTDDEVYSNLVTVLDAYQPKLIIVNFPSVDVAGHTGNWDNYLSAITNVDNIVFQLWNKIQSDSYYQNNTTLFITNDHGRHTANFSGHGDNCEGCQHIMLLALGRNVASANIVSETKYLIDIAPTVGDLLSFNTSDATGSSLYNGSNPLPVEMECFTYSLIDNKAILSWQTATEVNNYGFEIERSTIGTSYDSSLHWETLGFVEGHGNSNSPKLYEFVDENLLPDSAKYRLKQIDTDGKVTYYSETVKVNGYNTTDVKDVIPTEYSLSQNYPNPFNPNTIIRYSITQDGFVSLKVFNSLGEIVSTLFSEHKSAGNYTINFNSDNLSSGIYLYRIEANDFNQTKKMVLIR